MWIWMGWGGVGWGGVGWGGVGRAGPGAADGRCAPTLLRAPARAPAQVRPGVLVLINDCDWELEGGLDAELADGDVVSFISTLHGG